MGAGAVIIGLYIVLWGKAIDHKDTKHEQEEAPVRISACDDVPILRNDDYDVLPDGSSKNTKKKTPSTDLQELFLHHKTSNPEEP
ncbi:hypothetical protein CDL15_Pgr015294 [Punica granatum]|uniref:WAT1-related protein n=1 Tax=Punica granatum TaxID=22663 RepID=A0A218W024_PUNGR|nr:hypothetical protein CDL15_Pgr015294 [Punica granatum]